MEVREQESTVAKKGNATRFDVKVGGAVGVVGTLKSHYVKPK